MYIFGVCFQSKTLMKIICSSCGGRILINLKKKIINLFNSYLQKVQPFMSHREIGHRFKGGNMRNQILAVLVIFSLVEASLQDVDDNKIDSEPLKDIAKEILKKNKLGNIGGIVEGLLQNGEAKQLLDGVLQNLGKDTSGQILESLGSILGSASGDNDDKETPKKVKESNKKLNDDVNPMELLATLGTLGSLVGAMQGGGGGNGEGNPGALLQGLGSLLAGGNNEGNGDGGSALLQGLGSLLAAGSPQGKKEDGDSSAALLQGLGSILGAALANGPGKDDGLSKGKKEDGDGAGALLQGLGSILGAAVANGAGNNGGSGAGALLQGLGSLLGGAQGNGEGGINPELIGSVLNMFADTSSSSSSKSKTPKKVANDKKARSKAKKAKNLSPKNPDAKGLDQIEEKQEQMDDFDVDFIFDYLPLFFNMGKSFAGPEFNKFFDTIEDARDVYKEIMDKDKKFDLQTLAPKLFRIYGAYNEFIKPILKSAEESPKERKQDSFDIARLINVASSFLGETNANGGKGQANFMDYLPMIMNTLNAFTGEEAKERAEGHSSHTSALPPVLERVHIYFDNFINSDMGKQFMDYLKEQKAFKEFLNKDGNFDYEKFENLIENHSFRRYWIQQVTVTLVDFLKVMADKKNQDQYVNMGVTFTNSYLQSAGFPKNALIDLKKPAESITKFVNYATKKYLDAPFDTKPYVEPAILYSKELLNMAQASISSTKVSKELTEKLTDTINMEIIEPVTRVNRAYRFAKSEPKCDKYVFCVINQNESNEGSSLPNVRKALYKGFSLIAGWFLSSHTGTSYWDLYGVLMEGDGCKAYYKDSCKGFYNEEIKASTEYIHTEL